MMHVPLLNCAAQPVSQSCLSKRSDVSVNSEKARACVACFGRLSNGSVPLCVEYTLPISWLLGCGLVQNFVGVLHWRHSCQCCLSQ